MNKYYSGKQLDNYHQKKGKGKLKLFRGNIEQVIPIYAGRHGLIIYGINVFNVLFDYNTKKQKFYILNPFGKIASTLNPHFCLYLSGCVYC